MCLATSRIRFLPGRLATARPKLRSPAPRWRCGAASRTGKPETATTGAWPIYSAELRAVGVIGGEKLFRMDIAPRDAELRVWQSMYRLGPPLSVLGRKLRCR